MSEYSGNGNVLTYVELKDSANI